MAQTINTGIRTALIEGINLNKGRDFTDMFGDIQNIGGFCKKKDTNLEIIYNGDGTITIKKGIAFVKYTKSNGTDGLIKAELSEDKTLDISGEDDGTYFISFKLDQDKIDNGSDSIYGDDVFTIEFDTSEYDYTICKIDKSGTDYTITDKRDTIKLGKLQVNGISLEEGILNIDTKLTIGSQEIIENTDGELEASGTIKATAFKGDGSGLSNVKADLFLFGDGSDGDLVITSGTTNLNLNQVYQFSSISISSGAILSTDDLAGVCLIRCNGDVNIDGDINLSNKIFTEFNSSIFGRLIGGSGGAGGDGCGADYTGYGGNGDSIYGCGGGGGGSNENDYGNDGGDGGDGGYPGGTGGEGGGDSTTINGGTSAGGGGGHYNGTPGDGGDAYGNNGQDSDGGDGGGGGAGGASGAGLLLYTSGDISGSGNILLNGQNGGNGGSDGGDYSGGGGGGGGGGYLGLIYGGGDISNINIETKGGNGGTHQGSCGNNGEDGSDGHQIIKLFNNLF